MSDEQLPPWAHISSDFADNDEPAQETTGEEVPSRPFPPYLPTEQATPTVPTAPRKPPSRPVMPQPDVPMPQNVPMPFPPQPPTVVEPFAVPSPQNVPMPTPAPALEPSPTVPQPAPEPGPEPAYAPQPEVRTTVTQAPRPKPHVDESVYNTPLGYEDADDEEPDPPAKKGFFSSGFFAPPDKKKKPSGKKKPVKRKGNAKYFRIFIYFFLFLVLAVGLKNMVAPPVLDEQSVIDKVLSATGATGFPSDQAQSLAERFTTIYLTQDPQSLEVKQQRLADLMAPGADLSWLANTTSSEVTQPQKLLFGPFMVSEPESLDPNPRCDVKTAPCRALFTFVAQVGDGREQKNAEGDVLPQRWVTLAIPMVATETGVAVAGAPAFTPSQAVSKTGAPFLVEEDDDLVPRITPDLKNYFTAWGASSEADLSRYLVPNESTPEASAGLAGTVTFSALGDVTIGQVFNGDADRPSEVDAQADLFVEANVTWETPTGLSTQVYRLKVRQDQSGRWYVLDISGGGYGVES